MKRSIKQLLTGTLVGGVLIFVGNSVGWSVLPLANRAIHDLNAPRLVERIAAEATVLPGTYYVNSNDKRDGVGPGPIHGWMTIAPRESYSVPQTLLGSLVHNFLTALLMSVVLLRVRGGFRQRLGSALALACVALMTGPVWDWLWAFYSLEYALAVGLNGVLAYGPAAILVAKLVGASDSEATGKSAARVAAPAA